MSPKHHSKLDQTSGEFATRLLDWFDRAGRKDLPWQKKITPYRVWISEIMLQQTQVATVIPYYQKFMQHFPTLKALRTAEIDFVLHLWTGLGYYARARNLYNAAQLIHREFNDRFPNTLDNLLRLPGIGRSTAGAILSIAFQRPTPILDGNVKRVLSRYHAIDDIFSASAEEKLWKFAYLYTPTTRCKDYTQAIMDLGATVCTRSQPNCLACPLNHQCIAYQENATAIYPPKKTKTPLPVRHIKLLIMQNGQGEILLEKRPATGIWGGLWSLPECLEENISLYIANKFGYQVISHREEPLFRHTFTHFHLDITPVTLYIDRSPKQNDPNFIWCDPKHPPEVGLAAPIKKILLR